MPCTLYLTRNGLLEPLGQSQVLGYLRGLAKDYDVTLVTYEKMEDWRDDARMLQAREQCEALGIRWLPQYFISHPPLLAPALGLLQMIWLVFREVRSSEIQLIHARSYIPAGAALIVKKLVGTPFVFDMRALWPEELITARRIKRGLLTHQILVWVERKCLEHAAHVVSLTHAAVDYLNHQYPTELAQKNIIVIPTCADLDRFKIAQNKANTTAVHGCIGTVLSGWFQIDWLARWIAVASRRDPAAVFDIVTRDDPARVFAALDPEDRLGDRLKVGGRDSQDMPDAVSSHDFSIMFFTSGLGKLGSSPTRMAEVLGCGLPVVTNSGIGDVAKIVQEHGVGVLVKGPETEQIKTAMEELDSLLKEPALAERCRTTALQLFSLEAGTQAYRTIYSDITGM